MQTQNMQRQLEIEIDATRLLDELKTLATFTSVEPSAIGTAVTRIVFTPDDLRARAWLKQLAQAEGLAIREDAVGNTFFRWTGSEPGLPAVATGSHIDAIPHAGMYDGTVGVLGGLEAIRALKRSGLRPRRSIELVLLTSEEPTRFGIGCLGSRLISGTLSPERADALHGAQRGSEDETLAQVRAAAGFTGPLSSVRLPNGHYHAWVELHIEQGPLLEREGVPLGIVTAIAAPAGYRFTIEGIGGHAGALLMPDRRDALCAAAEIILSIENTRSPPASSTLSPPSAPATFIPARSTAFPAASSSRSMCVTSIRCAARASCRASAAMWRPSACAARSASPRRWSTPTSRPLLAAHRRGASTRYAAATASPRNTWSARAYHDSLVHGRASPPSP
jgi:hypothetical protein